MYKFFLACLLATALLGLPPVRTQATVPPPKKLTLAQALTTAAPPDGIWLTVSAEQVALPDGTPPPEAGASLAEIAAAFGDQTSAVGMVTVLALSTMAVLNTSPDPPDLSADLGGYEALKMLAASLDDSQWAMLISASGLGLSDLTDETQRGLFHALFARGRLWVGSEDPALSVLPDVQRTDVRDVSDQIEATRIRLGQTAHFYLHDTQGKNIYWSGHRPDAASRLHTWHPKFEPLPAEHGIVLKATVPNTPKSSNLDWGRPALQAAIPTVGIKTVGDLVSRIGLKTGLELYADPHYSSRTVALGGKAASASAADLLQALCLSIAGTFRQVGPAYVLTDDLLGVGVRRKRLQEWEMDASNASSHIGDEAGQFMLSHRANDSRKLSGFGDPLAVTAEEMAATPNDELIPGIPKSLENMYPFAKLSPAQQAWLRQTAAEYAEKRIMDDDPPRNADLTHNVDFRANYQLQLLVPTVSTPVDTNLQSPVFMLYYPGSAALYDTLRKLEPDEKAKAAAKLPPAPPLAPELHRGHIRAVLAHPRSAKDVDALVATMQTLGLNQLWLDAFSDGTDHVKASAASGPDIITEAITRTRGTGIGVYADLSLLSWGGDPPEAAIDVTLDGLNTRQQAVAEDKNRTEGQYDDDGKPVTFIAPPVQVSPFAAVVSEQLTALVKDLADRPGLSGLVWEDADTDSDLGYTPAMRLAFLRSAHADPWDITQDNSLRANVSLPLFDDSAIDAALSTRWAKTHTEVAAALLNELRRVAVGSSGNALPILVEQPEPVDVPWVVSWDDPKSLPPPLRDLSPGENYTPPDRISRAARSQGKTLVRVEAIKNDGDTEALARQLQDDAEALPADGFVLVFGDNGVTQGGAPLDSLVHAVSAQKMKQKTVK